MSARLLIIGLDGATWAVADRLIAQGRMPNLAALVASGARAPLRSTTPPMTLPAWCSMLTGCGPGRHGIFDFVRHRRPWELEFTNATHRKVPTLHRLLSDRGARVASIAVPTTWPPEPLNGAMVSGFDGPVATGIDASFCHPPELYGEIVRRFGGMKFADFGESGIGPGWHDDALSALLREIPRKEGIGRWLLGRERWDAFMLLLGESDTVSHHFWMFHDERSPRRPARCPPRLRDAIGTVYARLDAALGRLITAADPEVVCVCSDHGFGGAGTRVVYLNRFLEQHGWLRLSGGRLFGGGRGLDRLRMAAARRSPPALLERAMRTIPGPVLGRLESRSRYGAIDLLQTRAVSDEMNYAATIRLNVPDRDRDGAIAELRELLLGWTVEGEPVAAAVHTREELYEGAWVSESPDLVLELAERDGYSVTVLPSARVEPGTTWRELEPHEYMGGKGLGMNGTHRQHGVLALSGRGVRAGVTVSAGMADIAPTLLHLLGEDIPAHMDGRVITEAVGEAQAPRPRAAKTISSPPVALSEPQRRALSERLERLGYL